MKRYLAFFGSNYYPEGGMEDFIGDFNTHEQAVEAINETLKQTTWWEQDEDGWEYCWSHVWDSDERELVRYPCM